MQMQGACPEKLRPDSRRITGHEWSVGQILTIRGWLVAQRPGSWRHCQARRR